MATAKVVLSKMALGSIPVLALGAVLAPQLLSVPRAATEMFSRVLIVGGGPSRENNQISIESNVRYVDKITPHATRKTILFSDGDKTTENVNFIDEKKTDLNANLFGWLMDEGTPHPAVSYQRSQLPVIDGSTDSASINQTLQAFASQPSTSDSTLLYFTGHGSPGMVHDEKGQLVRGRRNDYENNVFNAWNFENFSVRDFATQLKAFSPQKPVVLVMVQCYSGSFGNLIFEDGDPKKGVVDRDFCGFFASVKERPAAGCTPEVNEANYQDFTSYFFAALSGQNRNGQKVTGADYDRNGRVSMLEAFAYTNIHDVSIDLPVVTSDVFLRSLSNDSPNWQKTSYSQLFNASAPWQKATLNELSKFLKFSGEDRLQTALKEVESPPRSGKKEAKAKKISSVDRHYEEWKTDLQTRFPNLKSAGGSAERRTARKDAIEYLSQNQERTRDLVATMEKSQKEALHNSRDVREARLMRFVRTARTVALEMDLRKRGDQKNLAILNRLRSYEARNPLL